MAVGVPLCSCRRMMSESPAALALESRFGRIIFPRLSLIEVGRSSRISLEKVDNLVDGFLDVVTRGLGSVRPDNMEYSSSMLSCAVTISESKDLSFLRSLLKAASLAMDGSSGLPLASDFFSRARFSAIEASRS